MDEKEKIRSARMALSAICEPGDTVAQCVIAVCGPLETLKIVRSCDYGPEKHRVVLAALAAAGYRNPPLVLHRAKQRWETRASVFQASRYERWLELSSSRFLIPEDDAWPEGIKDLDLKQPIGLWVRGKKVHDIAENREFSDEWKTLGQRGLALVGSRESSAEGEKICGDFSRRALLEGHCVVSGGAYGIDQRAHRAALDAQTEGRIPTLAVMASGLDRFYPAGNAELLWEIAEHGILVSESAPGTAPTRWRFLQRNRLIAALSRAVLVVQARYRSGALSTAHHALEMGRAVGAIPGSIEDPLSAGCHRLIREDGAMLVASSEDLRDLLGETRRENPVRTREAAKNSEEKTLFEKSGEGNEERALFDCLKERTRMVLEAVPISRAAQIENIARVAGVSVLETRSELALLELEGIVENNGLLWKRASKAKKALRERE